MTQLLSSARRGLAKAAGVGLIATAVTLGGVALASPAAAADFPTVGGSYLTGTSHNLSKPEAWISCQKKTHGKTKSLKYIGSFKGKLISVAIWECHTS